MNEILQKRIEEAAEEYSDYRFETYAFVAGAEWALSHQWISVEEALPKVNEFVFGCVNDEGTPQAVGMVYYDEYGDWHYSDEEEVSLITHWMDVPLLEGDEE